MAPIGPVPYRGQDMEQFYASPAQVPYQQQYDSWSSCVAWSSWWAEPAHVMLVVAVAALLCTVITVALIARSRLPVPGAA